MKTKRVYSIKKELIAKSQEAALTAVQVYNNPNICFKSETFIVLIIIAWTYLLHAYYRSKNIDYKYFTPHGKRRFYDRTKSGAYKFWELERCINCDDSPIDNNVKNNLKFLIGLRHEIEHQMTSRIDDALSAKFQSCCLNYNYYIKLLFGDHYGLDKYLSFSIQMTGINYEQKKELESYNKLPKNILSYITDFEGNLTEDEFRNQKYAYRVFIVQKTVNHKGQADSVMEIIKDDTLLETSINREYLLIKEREKEKYLPSQIVALMKELGFKKFAITSHTEYWQSRDAKNPKYHFGVQVANKQWYWYGTWLNEVKQHCEDNKERFS